MHLSLRDIHKSFGAHQVLKGISLEAEGGKAFGLLGRNGAGKTTTLRILMDVFPAEKGEILIDGKPIPRDKIRFGYLPEERGLYPKKKIEEQLIYFARLQGMEKKEAAAAVGKWLKRLGMSELKNQRLDTLSKGNQQKIQLVTALAHDPDIVILDEPFSGLDPVNARLLKEVVKEEIARGKVLFFSSHLMNYIEEFCDEIAILNQGQIVLSGNLHEIRHTYPRNKLVVRSPQAEEIARTMEGRLTEADTVLLTLPDPSDKAACLQNLAARYDLDEVRVFEPSLNDIFVEYTDTRKEAEEA